MQAGVVALGFYPVNIGDGNEENAAANRDGKTLRIVRLRASVIEQSEEALCGIFVLPAETSITGAREGPRKPVRRKGLEQVVHGVGIKCVERIAIECSHKYGYRHLFNADGFKHAKAVHFGHLYIEKD